MTTFFWRLLCLALATLAVGCAPRTEEGPLARVGGRRLDVPQPDPPPTPAEFRNLTVEALPATSLRFPSLRDDPGDVALREELRDRYREAGYHWVANFFDASVDPIFGRIVDYPTADTSVAWVEPTRSDAQDRTESEAIREVCSLVLDNKYQEAVDVATERLSEGPYSLREVAAWSYAALWYIVADAGPIEEKAPEIAFRVFLTSLEDAYPPQCLGNRAGGFQLIAGFFARWGDPVSAYTAAAIEHRLYTDSPPVEKTDAYTELLGDRIRNLRQEIEPYLLGDS